MGEAEVVAGTAQGTPVTVRRLVADLRALGVPEGGVVLAHSRLSALGWVAGGPEAVVEALLAVLGPDGTLVVPAFSTGRTEPSLWRHPPVPEAWWPVIRAETPAFDPRTASTRQMGAVADCVLRWPGARRSAHPHLSFGAVGPLAERVLEPHPLPFGLGEESPLARLYELDAHVLLLGVGHVNNSSLHLAEARAEYPAKRVEQQGAAVLAGGRREWVTFPEWETDDSDFPDVGAAFEASGAGVRAGPAGEGTARLMRQRELVDFGAGEIARRRATGG
ncbi:MAG TPA: AAC(3) family N-acetyltransferase [Mycobacteriales bacterium]|nr:AAC(3) family N-acetyltransferase [Mycobacteriales bacterium]